MSDHARVQPSPSPGAPSRPGWYSDPWERNRWRWWDGWAWTPHVSARAKKPALPGWLSVPVLVAAVLVVPVLLGVLAVAPHAVVLALCPMAIVLPVMLWLDRVEPEPRSALVHAFLWGATISVLVASIVNATVGAIGGDVLASILSAPFIEEAMKAGGILFAVRRREVDGPMDGIVYAGWTAVGFAVVEDVEYFVRASSEGHLAAVFVLRGLLSPFAHPLFTAWTGLAVGLAVSRGRPVFPSILWGYALAVLSHALWNGSAAAAQLMGDVGIGVLLLTVLAFVVLFFTFAVVLYRVRRKEERRFCELVPWLAQRYGLAALEVGLFGDFKAMIVARKRLAKAQRRWFDRMHAALARLAVLHDRPGGADKATEEALVAQLHHARSGTDP
jgi:RsiW-degrading membrane proteinase PrsW (M82 family)